MGWGGRWGAAGADVSASGLSGGLLGEGTGRAVQFLYPAAWSSEQLGQRAVEVIPQLTTSLRFPPLGQVGLGHHCSALK